MEKMNEMHKKKLPPIDWLWAAILERTRVAGYDLKALANIAGVSYDYMRRIYNRPTSEWPHGALQRVCKEYGITIVPTVGGSTPYEVFKL